MLVLIGCETSGLVREQFRKRGHVAFSCDILPADDGSPYHLQMDIFAALSLCRWDLLICHPPCTFLTVSANKYLKDDPGVKLKPGTLYGAARRAARAEAIHFATRLWRCDQAGDVVLENPVGALNTEMAPASQIVQPYEFGDDASKKTCLWIRGNLPLLEIDPAKRFPGRWVVDPRNGKWVERWSNQTDSGQNRLPPSDDRWKIRSETYPGIAAAMGDAWG